MSVRIKAGRMRFPVDVQNSVPTQGISGGESLVFQTLYTTNADIIPLSSSEKLNGPQEQAFATHRLIMRFNPDFPFKSKYQILYDTRVFQVISISDMDNLQKKLVVLVREEVD